MGLDEQVKPVPPSEVQDALEQVYFLEAEGNLEEALHQCNSVLRSAATMAEAHNLRAIILEQLGNQEEALEAYKTAIHLDSHLDDARKNLLELEEEILEVRHKSKRTNPWKVVFWGIVAYGVSFGLILLIRGCVNNSCPT